MKKYSKEYIKKRIKDSIPGWIFICPMVLGLCIFTMYPLIESLLYSFHDFDMITHYDYVGFAEYLYAFKDPDILIAVKNTVVFMVLNIPMVVVCSYSLALLLNMKVKGTKFFTVLYYLPCLVPGIAGGIIWASILKCGTISQGIFNQIREAFGFKPSMYIYSTGFEAIRSILLMNLFGVGGGTIIWLAAFKNIPVELYEAADIDGASKLVKLFKITIPLTGPLFLYNMVTLIIANIQFNGTLTFSPNGGTGIDNSTLFLGVKIYNTFQLKLDVGYSCALSWLLMIITAIITALTFKVNGMVDDGNS